MGSKDIFCRSSSAACEEPGALARAIPRLACARQSQVPSKDVSEFYPLVPPAAVAGSRLTAQAQRVGMEQEHGKP